VIISGNGARQRHGCNRRLTRNRMWPIEWHHCQCPWSAAKLAQVIISHCHLISSVPLLLSPSSYLLPLPCYFSPQFPLLLYTPLAVLKTGFKCAVVLAGRLVSKNRPSFRVIIHKREQYISKTNIFKTQLSKQSQYCAIRCVYEVHLAQLHTEMNIIIATECRRPYIIVTPLQSGVCQLIAAIAISPKLQPVAIGTAQNVFHTIKDSCYT